MKEKPRLYDWLLLGALLFAAGSTALHLDRGWDFTDESYYLLNSRYPHLLMQGSQFGHYTGLVFRLAGSSIALFRLAGMVLLLACGLFFALRFEIFLRGPGGLGREMPGALGRVSTIGLGVLCFYGAWLTTPSYNWVNGMGVLLAVAALLGAAGPAPGKAAGWGFLFGAASALSFMGRPLTAAALGGLGLVWAAAAMPRERCAPFFLAAAGAAALVFALHLAFFEKSLSAYLQEMKASLVLNGYFDKYRLSFIFFDAWRDLGRFFLRFLAAAWPLFPALAAAGLFFRRRGDKARGRALAFFYFAFWLLLTLRSGYLFALKGFLGLGCCVSFALVQFAFYPDKAFFRNRRFLLPLLLTASALAFALSSDNGVIRTSSAAFGLMAAAGIALAVSFDAETGLDKSSLVCLMFAVTVLVTLDGGMRRPYRQLTPLAAQTEPVRFPGVRGVLKVSADTKRYIDGMQQAAERAGWTAGTPLLDLSETPGAALVLGAVTPVTAWIYGRRYPGYAEGAFRMADPAELRRAWVYAPAAEETRRRVPEEVLQSLGLDFPGSYERVGEFEHPFRKQMQTLWKPKA
ncbi:MAG TPA: hypothetical protein VL688_03820 [Verrucomicrobiae bacterium]|nr:hypothetical protein [Verrucomicrobiae bacterium]